MGWPGWCEPPARCSRWRAAFARRAQTVARRAPRRKRLREVAEGEARLRLGGDERAVDGGQREARELVGDGVPRVVAERDRYLGPQRSSAMLADPPDQS